MTLLDSNELLIKFKCDVVNMSLHSILNIDGCEVHVFGVSHIPTNHAKGLDEIIENADIIAIEGYANSPNTVDSNILEKFLGKRGIEIIEQQAESRDVRIATIDPCIVEHSSLKSLYMLYFLINSAGVLLSLCYSPIYTLLLCLAALGVVGGYAALIKTCEDIAKDSIKAYEILQKFGQYTMIFMRSRSPSKRDIGLAYGVKRIVEEYPGKHILVVVGAAHYKNMVSLLECGNVSEKYHQEVKPYARRTNIILYKGGEKSDIKVIMY